MDATVVTEDCAYLDAQKYLQENQKNNEEYWRNHLAKIEDRLDLSILLSNAVRNNTKNVNAKSLQNIITNHKQVQDSKSASLIIKNGLYQELKILSKKEGVTVNVLLQYVWHKVLKVYGSNNIQTASPIITVVGTTVSGRNLPINDIEGSVGLYINTLPLIVEHNDNTLSLIDEIKKVQLSVTEINTRSNINLAKLQKDGARLFDTLFIFENYPVPTIQENQDSNTSENHNNKHTETKLNIEFKKAVEKLDYPLAVIAYETSQTQELTFTIKYAGELFDSKAIESLLNITENILSQVTKASVNNNLNLKALRLEYLSQKEKDFILTTWNNTDASYPCEKTIHQLFEEEAEKTPDKIALIYENKQLSYGKLNSLSNQLSHFLRKEGVVLDNRVGISAPRGLELVIGMLATLKAGGAYVPLDPEYPEDRLNYMLEDAGIDVLLTVRELGSLYQPYKGKIIYLDDYTYLAEPTTNLALTVPPNALAYVIYTSGSTGRPKGVACNQDAFINRLYWGWTKYKFRPEETMCLQSSISFVDSTWDIFGSLAVGARLVMYKEELSKSIDAILDQCSANKVTRITLVPSLLKELIIQAQENPRILKNATKIPHWEVTGEQFHTYLAKDFKRLLNRQINFLDCYGATEATSVVYKDFTATTGAEYTTCLLSNTQIYILDTNLNQVPIGAIGELFIGGVSLARGYLNRPGLTAEKFIANPFSQRPGERLYKTGDLARYLPDGNIEFIGRVDHQVKIRGFRIELGEIESTISSVSGVKQTIVLAREDEPGQKRLVAYVVPNNQIPLDEEGGTNQQNLITDIRNECSKNLPDYMRPSQIMLLAEMPLTPNGKIDRKALPKPEGREGLEAYQAPEGLIENSLAFIWRELLQVERVGRNDNFFHLGGNSLLLVKMLYMIKKSLNIQVSIKDIYHTESLANLADIISVAHRGDIEINNIILNINKTAAKPIFLIHPIGGVSLSYVPLKRFLPKQHIIGINDPYFGCEISGFSSITDMSSHYVNVIKNSYDMNNCILGGWSFGGEVAYRMACQLEQDSKKISKLILFDSFSPKLHNLLVQEKDEESDVQKSDYLFKQSLKRNKVIRQNEEFPKFYGQVYLFKAIAYDSKVCEINNNIVSQQKDNGWGDYCDNITIVNVNLSHGELLEEENLHILIQELRNII